MGEDSERLARVELEEVVLKIPLKKVAGSKTASLTLTSLRVFMTKSNGIFGELDVSIPLAAIDSFRFGWVRIRGLLLGAVIALLLGGVLAAGVTSGGRDASLGYGVLAVGVVLLIVFLLYRPTELIVRSGLEVAGGAPQSHDDAKKFMKALTQQLELKAAAK